MKSYIGYILRSIENCPKMHTYRAKNTQCISVYGANLFNESNDAMKSAKNLSSFKRLFKIYTLCKCVNIQYAGPYWFLCINYSINIINNTLLLLLLHFKHVFKALV